MRRRIMIDIEAYGKAPSGRIASIGVYAGRTASGEELAFYRNIDQKSMDSRVFTYDEDTMAWWDKQSAEAKAALVPNQVPLAIALKEMRDFVYWIGGVGREIWANPPSYDLAMLTYAFDKELGVQPPWHWRAERCFRTLKALGEDLGVKPPKREGTHHNALDDAIHQYEHMNLILDRITREGRLL